MKRTSKSFFDGVKPEDIFTHLTVGCANAEPNVDSRTGTGNAQETKSKMVCSYADLIYGKETRETSPKSIHLVGNRGMGKTLFSQVFMTDWCKGTLFNNKEGEDLVTGSNRIACLIPAKELNFLQEKEINFEDLLRNCSLMRNSSNLDNQTLINHVIDNTEDLLLVFDDFDDYNYFQSINFESGSQSPDELTAKMPVNTLINKILHKKAAKDCTIMVNTKSSNHYRISKLQCDQQIEISVLKEDQVLENVDKFFASKMNLLNEAAKEFVKDNEYFFQFARVPLLCFLMCFNVWWGFETEYMYSPTTLTNLYLAVIRAMDHSMGLTRDGIKVHPDISKTMRKISDLAVKLALDQRYSITDEDLRRIKFTDAEEAYFKSSGLVFPISCLWGNSTGLMREYRFCHPTLQDYFAAVGFVKRKETPGKKRSFFSKRQAVPVSEMVVQFMAGLIDFRQTKEMIKLLKYISTSGEYLASERILALRCIYEFENNVKEFRKGIATPFVLMNELNLFWEKDNGFIRIYHFTQIDSKVVAFFIDIVNSLARNELIKGSLPHTLYIENSCHTTPDDLPSIFSALANDHCPITRLWMENFCFHASYLESLSNCLSGMRIADLTFCACRITCQGALAILSHSNSLTAIRLSFNEISDPGKLTHSPNFHKLRELDLSYNQITDEGAKSILSNCKDLTRLNISYNCKLSKECKREIRHLCKESYPNLELII